MLEHLVIAMESEAQVVDIVRVSGFMQKVCSLIILNQFMSLTLCSLMFARSGTVSSSYVRAGLVGLHIAIFLSALLAMYYTTTNIL